MISISIIIHCYNDEKIIEKKLILLVKKLKSIKAKFEILAIDDGSKDKTFEKLNKIKQNYKNVKIYYNKRNMGKSYSIRKGLKKSKYNYVILTDSDLPYFYVFSKIVKYFKKDYDFVFVNRRHKKSSIQKKDLSFYQKTRYLAGYIVSLIIRSLLNLNIDGGDTQSGLKGFKKIKNFEDYEFISFKFFLDLEIFYLYRKLNKKFFSIPVKYDIDENSSIQIFSVKNFAILSELTKVILKLKSQRY